MMSAENTDFAAVDARFAGINEEADAVVIGTVTNITFRDGLRYAVVAVGEVITGIASPAVCVIAYARHIYDSSDNLGVGQRGLFFLVRHGDVYAVLGSGEGFKRFVA